MLKIYNHITSDIECIDNVELAFKKIVKKLTGNDMERQLIKKIDQGEYVNNAYFIDRFGMNLRIDCLSTGCKAALVVLHNPDKLVDLKECGLNAIAIIINHCQNGNILIWRGIKQIPTNYCRGKVDAEVNGKPCKSIYEINEALNL